MLVFVIGPLALFAVCCLLVLRRWVARGALRLVQRTNDSVERAAGARVRAERALDTVVRTGESDV